MVSCAAVQPDETVPEPRAEPPATAGILGLLWIFPESRFTPLAGGALTLGRGEECSVALGGGRASRVHARIVRDGPLHVVCDQASRNGTWVNGAKISTAALEEGDVLRAGDSVAMVLRVDAKLIRSGELFLTPLPGLVIGPRSRATWDRLVEIAPTTLPVIVEGATGSGKEVFARALHVLSGRSGEFLGVNCAALPDTLVEAQLFGHARGAYTGASQGVGGVFEAAHRGTLLLDELVELPPSQQAKLLRALEESAVTRLGESTPRKVDVRLVCASQTSLWALSQTDRFRGDLYARLSGATLELAPLNQRREEIPALFRGALAACGCDRVQMSGSFVEALCLADWALNVRELAQVARQVALLPQSELLTSDHLPALIKRIRGSVPAPRAGLPAFTVERTATKDSRRERDSASPRAPNAAAKDVLGARRAAWLERNQAHLDALLTALSRGGQNLAAAARSVGISHPRATRLLAARDQLVSVLDAEQGDSSAVRAKRSS